jgi:uncharacterized protein (TIGR03790 family)
LICCIFVAIEAFSPRIATATLRPDELVLIVNANVPSSLASAQFYARARLIPDGRIIKLNLPDAEEIPFDTYERDVVPPIKDFLRENHLQDKVRCAVTFYGIPLRIAAKQLSPQEKDEVAQLKVSLRSAISEALPAVRELESLAKQLDSGFQTIGGDDPRALFARAEGALDDINRHLPPAGNPARDEMLSKVLKLMQKLGGDAQIASKLSDADIAALLGPDEARRWPGRRRQIEAQTREVQQLQEKRDDAASRQKLRDIISDGFGLLGKIGLLNAQGEYLATDGSPSAFDSELALLGWNYYNHERWQGNPLYFRNGGQPHPPVLMVSRLDGPQSGTPNQIVLASLKAERDGLSGRAVIDSTGGLTPDGKYDREGTYRRFDDNLLALAKLISSKTKMPVTLDKKPGVLPPHSVKGVALYCGWYSVRNYVPSCEFVPGAIGYHIASYELVSLRTPGEKGWCAGLLNNGIAATLGAVHEPYLSAFPAPDEFFPLLLTGKLTLAECYWKTVPMTSWMMSLIGDPLYTPFAKDPQLKVEDLPRALQQAVNSSDSSEAQVIANPSGAAE